MANFSLSDVPLKVRGRSGFNKGHRMATSSCVGTLIPVLADEVVPGTRLSIKGALKAQLFPLASDTFMDLDYKLEGFFVPYRILYGGFENAVIGRTLDGMNSNPTDPSFINAVSGKYFPGLPVIRTNLATVGQRNAASAGSLSDYLGYKTSKSPAAAGAASNIDINIFPYLAYHMVYDHYYRNPVVQTAVFAPQSAYENRLLSTLPYRSEAVSASGHNQMGDLSGTQYDLTDVFRDGCRLGALRQRNFGDDYFTTARYTPQFGSAPTMGISVDSTTHDGVVTLASIRSLNALTQFAERHGIAGTDFDRWIEANYDVHPYASNKPIFLGHDQIQVYSNSVMQQAQNNAGSTSSAGASVDHANPFGTVGAKYGDGIGSGNFQICDDFLVTEPGIVMVIASLVPRVMYGTGWRRYLSHFNKAGWIADIANPILEAAGPQPIYQRELDIEKVRADITEIDDIFGYTDRYAEFKTMIDEVHGLLRDGEALDMFVLQRSFATDNPTINANFLRIPSTYLRQCMADQSPTFFSKFTTNAPDDRGTALEADHILDMWFDYKASMPLSRYSVPSLITSADNGANEVTLKRL